MNATNYTAAAMIPLIIAAALFFGVIVLNLILIRRWRGWWRVATCLPIAALVIWAIVIVVSIMFDPASHNLWPLELILWSLGTLVSLGLILLVRLILRKNGAIH